MNTYVKSFNCKGASLIVTGAHRFWKLRLKLQVRVAGAKHRGKARGFFLAAALFTRLFKMPVIAHDLQGSFAVNFFLQSPQRAFHWFAFF